MVSCIIVSTHQIAIELSSFFVFQSPTQQNKEKRRLTKKGNFRSVCVNFPPLLMINAVTSPPPNPPLENDKCAGNI